MAINVDTDTQIKKNQFYKWILSELNLGYAMTAHEISKQLYKKQLIPAPFRQAVAPRITELKDMGLVYVSGRSFDTETKKTVNKFISLIVKMSEDENK